MKSKLKQDLDALGSLRTLSWAALLLLTLSYLLLVVIPFYGSALDGSPFDPNCVGRCPDLDLRWYPLSGIADPDSALFSLAQGTFCTGPCLVFLLFPFSLLEMVVDWGYFSRRGKAIRLAIAGSLALAIVSAYASFFDILAWIIKV